MDNFGRNYYSENPFGEGYTLFKTNDSLQSFCRKYELPAEGLDRLTVSQGAWIIPVDMAHIR